ncbi:MAG: serine/threonine-protein kinase [Nannocystaceae bacterium]
MIPDGVKPGDVLGERYRLIRRLGEGGMGVVFRAQHVLIGRPLAVKILPPQYCTRPDAIERLLIEATSTAAIAHENIVDVMDFGVTDDGRAVYLVMELLTGEDLQETLAREGRLPWQRVLGIGLQLCSALYPAHHLGIIHRDLKPANCFRITRRGFEDFIKVLDFGIAKVLTPEGEDTRGLTQTGHIIGTLAYMAPEQAFGAEPTHKFDIHAVGLILYEALTGGLPYSGESQGELLLALHNDSPTPLREQYPVLDAPTQLCRVIERALAKNPADRFSDMAEFHSALAELAPDGACPPELLRLPTLPDEPAPNALHRTAMSTRGVDPSSVVTALRQRLGVHQMQDVAEGGKESELGNKTTMARTLVRPTPTPSTNAHRRALWLSGVVALIVAILLVVWSRSSRENEDRRAPKVVGEELTPGPLPDNTLDTTTGDDPETGSSETGTTGSATDEPTSESESDSDKPTPPPRPRPSPSPDKLLAKLRRSVVEYCTGKTKDARLGETVSTTVSVEYKSGKATFEITKGKGTRSASCIDTQLTSKLKKALRMYNGKKFSRQLNFVLKDK